MSGSITRIGVATAVTSALWSAALWGATAHADPSPGVPCLDMVQQLAAEPPSVPDSLQKATTTLDSVVPQQAPALPPVPVAEVVHGMTALAAPGPGPGPDGHRAGGRGRGSGARAGRWRPPRSSRRRLLSRRLLRSQELLQGSCFRPHYPLRSLPAWPKPHHSARPRPPMPPRCCTALRFRRRCPVRPCRSYPSGGGRTGGCSAVSRSGRAAGRRAARSAPAARDPARATGSRLPRHGVVGRAHTFCSGVEYGRVAGAASRPAMVLRCCVGAV